MSYEYKNPYLNITPDNTRNIRLQIFTNKIIQSENKIIKPMPQRVTAIIFSCKNIHTLQQSRRRLARFKINKN